MTKKVIYMLGMIILVTIGFNFNILKGHAKVQENFTIDQNDLKNTDANHEVQQLKNEIQNLKELRKRLDTALSASIPIIEKEYIQTIISAGNKYIGHSTYVFGGGRNEIDIANGRFDCSAFVHWVFAQASIEVGNTTDTLKTSGTQISVNEMAPGDLVFFNTYKNDGHVGIFLGDGKFIGSQSSTGVAIVDMTQGYWKETFSGRVIRIEKTTS
ncbi:C40 family peptidase [Neobacillus sp. LXY-4]|uniref:C40 family peptidase n=1 Tax=Neobacillus sp. LXY-4 TaxID=3379826 RepID=UPI003EE1592D